MTEAEKLLKALVDGAPVDWWEGAKCAYCETPVDWWEDLENIEHHKPDCPWRRAKEYLERKDD